MRFTIPFQMEAPPYPLLLDRSEYPDFLPRKFRQGRVYAFT